MKRITIIAYSAFVLIMVINVLFYRSLYRNQKNYSHKLLDTQVLIIGSEIDNTNMYIISDLTEIDFSDDIALFFSDAEINERTKEKIKLYYSKYEDIITSIMLYNITGDVYTLFKDEEKNAWLDGSYKAQTLPEIFDHDQMIYEKGKNKYYLPIIENGDVLGNFVITMDLDRYFTRLFRKYNLEEYQWQWMINDTGAVIYDNFDDAVSYSGLKKITENIREGIAGRSDHSVQTATGSKNIISSYYPINILGKDYGLVFSAPLDFFQKYLVRNALVVGIVTFAVILLIILMYRIRHRSQEKTINEFRDSSLYLLSIVDQMPVGLVLYNTNREILKANKKSAELFSYTNAEEMTGKLVPDLSRNEYENDNNGQIADSKIIKLVSASGERTAFRNSIPFNIKGEEAILDVFVDITSLELARKQEADANIAKSELLARMSYEIRTPLNGIIGMTEMLGRADLPNDASEIALLLRRSADLLLNIINDIFDVSKVETGKMILDQIPFRLREELNYCQNLVKRENPDNPVLINLDLHNNVPDKLIGDPYRLRQVITNLLQNSLSSTHTGRIDLACTVNETNGNEITLGFVIEDTGKKYSRTEIKKIFGDYITTRIKRAEWAEELKMGPILARHLVELMGGSLVAESPARKDGSGAEKGLKVSFSVKVHLNEKINKSLDLSRYNRVSEIKTLAITGSQTRDDDFLNIIHRLGIPVSVTSFQKYTISQIDADRLKNPDRYILLILFDEPETDGFEAAKALREANLAGEYIILMFTSKDPKGHYARCVDMGVDHLLVKPFAAEDLLITLKELFPALKGTGGNNLGKRKESETKILVVDDNYLNRKVVGSLLKVLGISADYAEEGNEAIVRYKENNYDLVLMDLIMPGVDGFEAARKILEYDHDALIIALSADNMPETKLKSEQTGMKELLAKPVSVDDLRRVIDKYLITD